MARQPLPEFRTPFAAAIKLKSVDGFIGKAAPMSHVYVTSKNYSGFVKSVLGSENAQHLERINPGQSAAIEANKHYPINFSDRHFSSVSELHAFVRKSIGNANRVNFVLVNGIGTGLGDNYLGLGLLQRLTQLLAPIEAHFCLMQELEERIAPVYVHQNNVSVRNCFMPLDEFMQHDFVIDFSSAIKSVSFNEVAAAKFNAHAFSVDKLVPAKNVQPRIITSPSKTARMRETIDSKFSQQRPCVLLHPLASSAIRLMPNNIAANIVKALIAQGYNVVSAFPHKSPPQGFADLSEHSKSLDDLVHIINAVDAVISVGTVVYHLAAALSKPTVLIPTVQADIRSAKLLPEVLAWVPGKSKDIIPNLHKSDNEKDIAVAAKIWANVDTTAVAEQIGHHLMRFTTKRNRAIAPEASPRVAVIVPFTGEHQRFTRCLDALNKVAGFDPLHLYSINLQGSASGHYHYTNAFNEGIVHALKNGCDYIWLLHEAADVSEHYLQTTLQHFSNNADLGIVGGSDPGVSQLYAGLNFLPDYLTVKKQSRQLLRQPWITFSSAVIRAEVFDDLKTLDASMERLFCDADFCIRAARNGWQTWQDPCIKASFDRKTENQHELIKYLQNSAKVFYTKWGKAIGETEPEKIEDALLSYIEF